MKIDANSLAQIADDLQFQFREKIGFWSINRSSIDMPISPVELWKNCTEKNFSSCAKLALNSIFTTVFWIHG